MTWADLANHLWQSTVFLFAAWALTAGFLRKNSAGVRRGVWTAASVKFLIPFAALASLGGRLGWLKLAAPRTRAEVHSAMDQVSYHVAPALAPSTLAPANPAHGSWLPYLLAIAWAAGTAMVAMNWWLRWRRVKAARRAASFVRMAEGFPVLSSPALRDRGLEPGVFGWWRPVVLVPEGIERRLAPEQLEAVLAHECCHARRRDNLTAAIPMSVEALFWFHPLVWWLGQKLMQERERACDEEVLRQGNDPAVYAEGILNICKFYVESPLHCVAGVTGSDLKRRIEEIMSQRMTRGMSMTKKLALATVGIASVAGPVAIGLLGVRTTFGQTNSTQYTAGLTTTAERKFDVASIRPNDKDPNMWQLNPPRNGELHLTNMPIRRIVASAFRIQDSTVVGPSAIDDLRYDINAKGPDAKAGYPEVWEMLRRLLADRFQLKYHVEKRDQPVLALVVAKGGPKLKRPEDGPCAEQIKRNEHCANLGFSPYGISIVNMPIQGFLSGLARLMGDRHLVDKTGLTGDYDVEVSWAPDTPPAPGTQPQLDEGAMFTALQEQAGLKLEAQRGLVDFLVIDHVEKASDN